MPTLLTSVFNLRMEFWPKELCANIGGRRWDEAFIILVPYTIQIVRSEDGFVVW